MTDGSSFFTETIEFFSSDKGTEGNLVELGLVDWGGEGRRGEVKALLTSRLLPCPLDSKCLRHGTATLVALGGEGADTSDTGSADDGGDGIYRFDNSTDPVSFFNGLRRKVFG